MTDDKLDQLILEQQRVVAVTRMEAEIRGQCVATLQALQQDIREIRVTMQGGYRRSMVSQDTINSKLDDVLNQLDKMKTIDTGPLVSIQQSGGSGGSVDVGQDVSGRDKSG